MTFNIGTVAGGTHSGWRTVKEAGKPWACNCSVNPGDALNPGYLVNCPDCGMRRPD